MSAPTPTLNDRFLKALRAIVREMFPRLDFFGVYEFTVQSTGSNTADLVPTDTTLGLPSMVTVPLRLPTFRATLSTGSTAIVTFVNGDPSRPFVLTASSATEHLMTTEATVLLIYNTFAALFLASGSGPLISATLQPLLAGAITTALTAQTAPAPPGSVAQIAANALAQSGFAAGNVTVNTMFLGWTTVLANLSNKVPDVSGLFPSIGHPSGG